MNKDVSITIIKETPTRTTVRWTYLADGHFSESAQRKMLCIGGPLDGQRLSFTQAWLKLGHSGNDGMPYCQFNRAEWRKKGTPDKSVLIYQPTSAVVTAPVNP